jgi:NADH:ubiquinone oxidoreductase subunit 4 (subunit M)
LGDKTEVSDKFHDLVLQEKIILIPVILAIFILGVYPKPFIEIAEPAVKNLFSLMSITIK